MKPKMVAAAGAILCCMLFVGCWNKQQQAPFSTDDSAATDSLPADTLYEAADTLLLDKVTEEAPIPATVDEFFGDFIFNFDQSNRLQRNRIRFPLPVKEADGSLRHIGRRDWQHHFLFMQQEFTTVLWSSRQQMELAQDTALTRARVEQIYLHSRLINAFVFERDSLSRQWMLTEQYTQPFEQSELCSFLDFYRQFATDSIYQRRHVADPLRFTTTDEENEYDVIEGTINADQWFEFQPEMSQDVLTNIYYGQSYSHPHRIYLQMRGINNGLQNLFTFQREGDHWRLKAFEN